MLKKIDHINIVVKDLPTCKNFFLELGFQLIHEGKLSGDWVDSVTGLEKVNAQYCALGLENSETAIELICYDSPKTLATQKKNLPNQLGFRHVAFAVSDIESIVKELKQKGFTFFSDIQHYEPSNKKLCYFYGPEGIILELAEYELR